MSGDQGAEDPRPIKLRITDDPDIPRHVRTNPKVPIVTELIRQVMTEPLRFNPTVLFVARTAAEVYPGGMQEELTVYGPETHIDVSVAELIEEAGRTGDWCGVVVVAEVAIDQDRGRVAVGNVDGHWLWAARIADQLHLYPERPAGPTADVIDKLLS